MRQQFQEWYAGLVCAQVQKSRVELIDLRLSIVKSLEAKWTDKLYDYLKSKPEIVMEFELQVYCSRLCNKYTYLLYEQQLYHSTL